MEKLMKVLHKKLDQSTDKIHEVKIKKKKMEDLFAFDKLEYQDKNEFDYFKNEIMYQGILNKQAIEKAYKEGRTKMYDYYEVLSYPEKKRLMNYEISLALNEMICFIFEEQKIYIPFFEKKMNAIYENEMVLFDLKQYNRLMLDYKELILDHPYGYRTYDSEFSSLILVYEKEEEAAFYSEMKGRLYFLKGCEMLDFISLPFLEKEQFSLIASAYFEQDKVELVSLMSDFECINEKTYKKLMKISNK